MITKHTHKDLVWVDIENPTPEDIETVIKEFSIHRSWAQELLSPSPRAKTESGETAFYAALHYPDHPSERTDSAELEVDYVIGPSFIITAHYQPIDMFRYVATQFDAAAVEDQPRATTGTELFLVLNNELYRGLREELEAVRKQIKEVEANIFKGHEFKMVRELSNTQRRLLDFKQAIRPHKIILKSLHLQAPLLFPGVVMNEDNLFREYLRVESALENCRELLLELRDTNDSLLSSKTNDVIKKLTLMAFVTFPLSLIAIILFAPESPHVFHGSHGFWLVIAVLIVLYLCMHIYFAYKKWI